MGGEGLLVLLVEDTLDTLEAFSHFLRGAGFRVETATDGREAVDKARALRPDVVVMDLALPELDGWEASRRLKADPKSADIPIIALTAFAMREDEERARKAGCDGYLSKPCRPQTIRATVRNFLAPR